MALVVLGLFVLVWIISAVVKASQDPGPKRPQGNRPRPVDPPPRAERTSNTDIDRFMAEIDRLRRKGEGLPAGSRAPEPQRPAQAPIIERPPRLEPRPRPAEPPRRERERDRDRERRPRQSGRPAPPPTAPARTDPVPVLRPVTPEPPSTAPSAPIKPATTSKTKATAVAGAASAGAASPVLQTLQSLLKDRNGPAAALILAEVFGEPRARQPYRLKGS
jgi:hypothetical protein